MYVNNLSQYSKVQATAEVATVEKVSSGVSASVARIGDVETTSDTFNFDYYLLSNDEPAEDIPVAFARAARSISLADLLTMVMNIERSAAIEMSKMNSLFQINASLAAADELRSSAKSMLTGAITGFAFNVVGSGFSMVQSARALHTSGVAKTKGAELQTARSEAAQIKTDIASGKRVDAAGRGLKGQRQVLRESICEMKKEHKNLMSMSTALNAMAGQTQHLAQSASRVSESIGNSMAKADEADSQTLNALAGQYKDQRDNAVKIIDNIKQLFSAVMQVSKDVRDAQDQVRANIARNA